MNNKLFTKSEVINLINAGHVMLLSGSDKALKGLPKGKWIAGTTPYFMDGIGKVDEENIFVDDSPTSPRTPRWRSLTPAASMKSQSMVSAMDSL